MGWAEALSGLGAGLSGNSAQWQIAQSERMKSLAELDEQRQKAMAMDLRGVNRLIKSGDIGGATQLLQNRLEHIAKLGGDPTHTANLNRMISEGRIEEASAYLDQVDQAAVQDGLLPSMAPKYSKIVDTADGGKAGYNEATGKFEPIDSGGVTFAPGGGGGVASLGMTRLFKDQAGNLFYGANVLDKATGQMRVDMVPTSGDPATRPSGTVTPVDPYGNNAMERVGQKAAESQAAEGGKLAAQAQTKPRVEALVKAAVDQVAAATAQSEKSAINSTALQTYDIAMNGLVEALGGTTTGPIAGWLPALTDSAQIAGGAVAAMAPVLKQIFRSAGEGIFTDKDQALLMEMVPTRKDRPAAAVAKIRNIDAIVRSKLGVTGPAPDRFGGQAGQPSTGAPSGGKLMVDANGNKAYVYPDGRIEEVR